MLIYMKPIARLSSFLRLLANIKFPLSTLIKLKILGKENVFVHDKGSGVRMLASADSFQILSETFYNRDYDVTEIEIRPGDLVIDAGANHGYFTCYMAAKGAKVIAVEPAADNLEWLRKNIAANGFDKQVTIVPKALGTGRQSTSLYKIEGYAGALYATNEKYMQLQTKGYSSPPLEVTVPQCTLPDLFDTKELPNVRMLKLDCEGAEMEILSVLTPAEANQFDCIVMEFHHSYSLAHVFDLAKSWGCFQVSLANQLPWSARQIVKMVNNRMWPTLIGFPRHTH